MIVSFSKLPDSARIWVFPSSRKLYPQEIPELEEKLDRFLSNWPSENSSQSNAFQILYKHFIVIGIDDSSAALSLNEHDTLISFVQELETAFNILLLDRINVTYKQGEYVQYKELNEFKKLIKNRSISNKTIVFDNMITTKEALNYDWEIPITDSWLSRFLK
jgi:hypothetical protein